MPLLPSQLAIIAEAELTGDPGCRLYVEWQSDHFDLPRLRQAWHRIVQRHPALRAVIEHGRQRIRTASQPLPIEELDVSGGSPEAAERALCRLRSQVQRASSPLAGGPLFELRVIRLAADESRLLLGVDQLAADVDSLERVLLPEFQQLYHDGWVADGLPAGCAADAVQPAEADYATSIRRWSTPEPAGHRYWLDRLSTLPPAPALPAAGPRRPEGFERHSGTVDAPRWATVLAHAQRNRIGPTELLLAGYLTVLGNWSATEEFSVAAALPRTAAASVGPFGWSALLAMPAAAGRFADRARALASQLSRDLAHGGLAAALLVGEHDRQPDSPVVRFPVTFSSQLGAAGTAIPGSGPLGTRVAGLALPPHAALALQVTEDEHGLRHHWDARTSALPPGVLSDLAGAFDRLLLALADHAGWTQDTFELTPPEQLAVRARVNATAGPVPVDLLHAAVAGHAQRNPTADAVITSDRRLSYREFDRRVNQVGRRLRELGLRPNRLAAIVLDKGWEQLVAAHGVLAAGGAYLPIDPTVPTQRLHHLLKHSEAELVLTSSSLATELAWPDGITRLCVERDFDEVDGGPLAAAQQPTDLAYVIYTSGSTGLPKGVMVDHRGALNTIDDINDRFAIGPADRCLAVSGLHFDLSVYDTFGMLRAGGAVVVPDAGTGADPKHWSELMARERVTFWNSVPALLEMLAVFLRGCGQPGRIEALRLAVLAGDWIPVGLPDRLRALNPALTLIGSGGPTETCIWSVIFPIGEVDPDWRSIPYGRPMTNQRYHVLNERRRPCPTWVAGELHVSSEIGLARGYWRDPAGTAAKFTEYDGTRSYATGDLGRYLPDGTIEILGRTDFQVKIQGVRVELGEVEATIAAHPAVAAAVVVASGSSRDLLVLRAFLVWSAEAGSIEDVRQFLAARLPKHLVPAAITALDSFPLTGNGKVDRLALSRAPRRAARAGRDAS